MRKFDALVGFLLSKGTPTTNEIVEFKGYTTKGDGGGGTWKHNGVTGQTVSRSPIQLADGLLNDASGNQWALISKNSTWAASLGVLPSNSDNVAAIEAASQHANTALLKYIDLPSGILTMASEFKLNVVGQVLRGRGSGTFADGLNQNKTQLLGTSTTGAVVRIQLESCGVEDLLIEGDGTRSVAAINSTTANYNCGLRIEAADVAAPEGDVFDTRVKNVQIRNQPNDGVLLVGRCGGTELDKVICKENAGHGINIGNGEASGRTNTELAGVINIKNSRWEKNDGHGIKAGQDNDTDYTYRIVVDNCEGLNNLGDVALQEAAGESFFHCDGLTILNGAASGNNRAGTATSHAGYALKGLGGSLIDTRILSTTVPVLLVKSGTRDTSGWNVLSPHIRTTLAAHIVEIQTGCKNIYVNSGDETGLLTSATDITTISGLHTIFNDTMLIKLDTTLLGTFIDNNGLSIVSDNVDGQNITTTPFTMLDASTAGKMWKISLRHTGNPCLSSCTFDVVGGSTPVISNIINQVGASVTYTPAVSATDVTLVTSAGTRNSDIFIKETVTA